MSTYEEIKNAALALPPEAQSMLAEHLMESLDAEDQERSTHFGLKKPNDAIKKLKTES